MVSIYLLQPPADAILSRTHGGAHRYETFDRLVRSILSALSASRCLVRKLDRGIWHNKPCRTVLASACRQDGPRLSVSWERNAEATPPSSNYRGLPVEESRSNLRATVPIPVVGAEHEAHEVSQSVRSSFESS